MQFPNNNNKDQNRPPGEPPNPQQNPDPDWRKWFWPMVFAFLLIWLFLQLMGGVSPMSGASSTITYDELLNQAQAGNVQSIIINVDGNSAEGIFAQTITLNGSAPIKNFTLTVPSEQSPAFDTLINVLDANGAQIELDTTEISPFWSILATWGPLILIIVFFIWVSRRAQRQMGNAMGFGRTQAREYTLERPQVTFNDVAGQDAAKRELVEIVDFLREPDKYIALGARIPRGVLLIGPPGTGKTLLARAVAGEANVSFFSIAASEFVEMFVGVGASRVRDLFRRAKENAPSIVFIDEIDAVGRQRGAGLGGGHDEREQTLNQMLAEMDGFDQNESVIVMAATNRNDVLDPALLRPGRFDRQVTVGLPDRKGRYEILKIHTRGKPLDHTVDLESLSRGTIGFSGADLANLANEAALNAARRNAKKISMRDFSDAFDRIVLGTESPPLSDPHERKVVAYHEAGHALVAALTPKADPVLKITIVPRGQALGVTAQMPDDDRRNYAKSYLDARMKVLLGGRAAEEIIFGEVTTGAENDLRRVTDLARRMVAQFGMSDVLGQVNFGDDDRQPFLGYSISQGRHYSEETAAKIDREVSRIIKETYEATRDLLKENRDKLTALAEELLIHEVIEQQEMLRILGLEFEDVLPDDPDRAERVRKRSGHFSLSNGGSDENPVPTQDEKQDD
ncbi:MAG: cell division protein FtsH [Phototrophicales bacterium]|nr:MAG: cell division protein FtsH [Phototrophicales bacterium]RMG77525.1 MAG: ATP-dependent metallopeptidase FtsH/Yme1/Tma family protein [Chloroflexota bacterium]